MTKNYYFGYMANKRQQKNARIRAFLAIFVVLMLFGLSIHHFATVEPLNGNFEPLNLDNSVKVDSLEQTRQEIYEKTGLKLSDFTFYA